MGTLWVIFLIADWCQGTQLTGGGACPGLLILNYIEKQVEEAMRRNTPLKGSCII